MTTTTEQTAVRRAPRRGRETALDMVRTLAIVFALVLPMYLFHQGGPGSRQRIRAVDPTEVFVLAAKDFGAPVPAATPQGWTCTVRDTATTVGVARVGYVVGDHYVEYAASTGDGFLPEETGNAQPVGTVDVAGVVWQQYRNSGGAESLVLRRGKATVLVGGLRETGTPAELRTLAAAVR